MTVQRRAGGAFLTTTKMAAADVEWSVDYAFKTVLNKLEGFFSLKEEQRLDLKSVENKLFSCLRAASPFNHALIGCRSPSNCV